MKAFPRDNVTGGVSYAYIQMNVQDVFVDWSSYREIKPENFDAH